MDDEKILDSWKEIAGHLRRNVRTCQRWEREMGLPVHRLDGSSKARVFAYAGELDHWLAEKSHEMEEGRGGHVVSELAPSAAATGRSGKLTLKKALLATAGFALLAVTALVGWRFLSRKGVSGLLQSGKPSLAILEFDNTSGNKSLAGWRVGLSNLLIAGLSDSKFISVLPDDRIYSLLKKLNLLETGRYSTEELVSIARSAGVTHTASGAFLSAGDKIVITLTVQKPLTGEIVRTSKVECNGEGDIIAKADQLVRQIKQDLALTPEQITKDGDRELGRITTPSAEAFKYYSEGLEHQYRNEWEQAVADMEKAVALDPEFAMAYKAMATAHRDLGHIAEARKFMAKALELRARLPAGEPLFIVGQLAYWDQDYAKVIEIFGELLKTYPEHLNAHRYLGYAYNGAGDIDKAIEHQEFAVLNRKTALDVRVLAAYYQKKGWYQKAEDICRAFLKDVEDLWNVRQMLIYSLAFRRHFDQAMAEAENNYLEDPRTKDDLGAVLIFRDDLAGAEKVIGHEAVLLNRGRFEENIDVCRRNLERSKGRKEGEAAAFRELARALEKAGRHEEAYQAHNRYLELSAASRDSAGETGRPYLPDRRKGDLFSKGRLLAKMKSFDAARRTAEELRSVIAKGINTRELRYCEDILGLVEIGKGRMRQAADLFTEACARLDFEDYWHTEQALFFDDLARALYESGDMDRARKTFKRVTLLTTGRLEDGDLYAKAFYMMGKIAERKGEKTKARENYERFLGLWKNADPGIPEVEDARKKVAGL